MVILGNFANLYGTIQQKLLMEIGEKKRRNSSVVIMWR